MEDNIRFSLLSLTNRHVCLISDILACTYGSPNHLELGTGWLDIGGIACMMCWMCNLFIVKTRKQLFDDNIQANDMTVLCVHYLLQISKSSRRRCTRAKDTTKRINMKSYRNFIIKIITKTASILWFMVTGPAMNNLLIKW